MVPSKGQKPMVPRRISSGTRVDTTPGTRSRESIALSRRMARGRCIIRSQTRSFGQVLGRLRVHNLAPQRHEAGALGAVSIATLRNEPFRSLAVLRRVLLGAKQDCNSRNEGAKTLKREERRQFFRALDSSLNSSSDFSLVSAGSLFLRKNKLHFVSRCSGLGGVFGGASSSSALPLSTGTRAFSPTSSLSSNILSRSSVSGAHSGSCRRPWMRSGTLLELEANIMTSF